MKYLLFLFLLIPSICNAQIITIQACTSAQTDAANQTAGITADNNQIANNQSDITTRQAQLALDNATVTQCNAGDAQTISGWNFAYDAQLESVGCRWATCFPVIFPNANLTAIAAAINITCPVTEAQVAWTNWPAYSAIHGSTAATWNAFYCGDGPAS